MQKIVIEISEEDYEYIQTTKHLYSPLKMAHVILNGKPLDLVLDEIRAEIEALEEGITSYHSDRPWIFKDEVLDIIDKYKVESEETDA